MQARYYDPVIGRFYSNDPVDAVSHLSTPNGIHGFNRYAYANNNPYKYTDPNGESSSAAFTGHLQLEQNKQLNQLKSKMTAGEFKQVEKDAKDIITGAAALLPGGQIFDVANIIEDIAEGGAPIADGSGLAAGEGASATSDAIDKDLSAKPGSVKSKIVSAVVGVIVGEATTELVQPSQDIVENKGLPPEEDKR